MDGKPINIFRSDRRNLCEAIESLPPRGSRALVVLDEGDLTQIGWSGDRAITARDLLFYAEVIRARALEMMFTDHAATAEEEGGLITEFAASGEPRPKP